MTSSGRPFESLKVWVRQQLRAFADRVAQYLLWAGALAAVSFGGVIVSAFVQAYRNRWIVIGFLAVITVVSALTVVLVLYRRYRLEAYRASQTAWEELTNERDHLEQDLEQLQERFDRETSGSEEVRAELASMLDELQLEIVTGKVDIEEFVQESILQPMRDVLRRGRRDVRICVLEPRADDPEVWRMRWEAGHRRSVRGNFGRRIDDTVAGLAFRNGRPFLTADVHQDDRVPSPKSERFYKSQIALPVAVGRRRVAVLSIVSHEEGAFGETDVTFGQVVGTVLAVALAIERLRDRTQVATIGND